MARYSKRHYEDVAKIIRKQAHPDAVYTYDDVKMGQQMMVETMVNEFVNLFKADNPRFDVDRFTTACGT